MRKQRPDCEPAVLYQSGSDYGNMYHQQHNMVGGTGWDATILKEEATLYQILLPGKTARESSGTKRCTQSPLARSQQHMLDDDGRPAAAMGLCCRLVGQNEGDGKAQSRRSACLGWVLAE